LRGTDESVTTPEFEVIAGRPTDVTIKAIRQSTPAKGMAETEFVASGKDSFKNPANAGEAVNWYYSGWGETVSSDGETDENGEARVVIRAELRDDGQEIDVQVDGESALQPIRFNQTERRGADFQNSI